jgi:hypothetical protein
MAGIPSLIQRTLFVRLRRLIGLLTGLLARLPVGLLFLALLLLALLTLTLLLVAILLRLLGIAILRIIAHHWPSILARPGWTLPKQRPLCGTGCPFLRSQETARPQDVGGKKMSRKCAPAVLAPS